MLRSIRFINFVFNKSNSFLIKNESKVSQCAKNNLLWQRMISVGTNCLDKSQTGVNKPREKTEGNVKIMLIYPNGSMIPTIFESAVKIAKRKNFQLIHVPEKYSNNDRSVYKLVPIIDLINAKDGNEKDSAESKIKHKLKDAKLFTIKTSISEHDLNIKINNINKLLNKNYEVKILIHSSEAEMKEDILKIIKDKVKGKIKKEQIKSASNLISFIPLDILKTDSNTVVSQSEGNKI